MMRDWQPASAAAPCPICGRKKYCGGWPATGKVLCTRHDTAPDGTPGRPGRYKDGGEFWVFVLDQDAERLPVVYEAPVRCVDRAPYDVLDRAYRIVLDALPHVSGDSLAHMVRRGFTEVQVHEEIGCRSLRRNTDRFRIAARVVDSLGLESALGVPGLYMKATKHGEKPFLGGAQGIVIPCRDLSGRVLALKIRVLDPDTVEQHGKYLSLSSSGESRGNGPSAIPVVHVPAFRPAAVDALRVTEGELKAEILTRRTGILTISIPGVDQWRRAMPVLREFRPRRVLVAFDGNWQTNPDVARNLSAFLRALKPEEHDHAA